MALVLVLGPVIAQYSLEGHSRVLYSGSSVFVTTVLMPVMLHSGCPHSGSLVDLGLTFGCLYLNSVGEPCSGFCECSPMTYTKGFIEHVHTNSLSDLGTDDHEHLAQGVLTFAVTHTPEGITPGVAFDQIGITSSH